MSRALLTRIGLAMLIGLLVGVLVNEVSFAFLREESRPPGTIELVIPAGSADLVAARQQPPAIPESMTFVAGDTLVVRNEDAVAHQLGPLWVPAGSQASLKLETAGSFVDECSFQASRSFDLTVHPPLTFGVRFQGIFLSGVPLGVLLALYAAVAWPLKPRPTPPA